MNIQIVDTHLSKTAVQQAAQDSFGDMVKVVVDIEKKIVALGGELHADAEALLIEAGSDQKNVWGANIFPDRPTGEQIEFISLINIRPKQGNRGTEIQDRKIREAVAHIIHQRLDL